MLLIVLRINDCKKIITIVVKKERNNKENFLYPKAEKY